MSSIIPSKPDYFWGHVKEMRLPQHFIGTSIKSVTIGQRKALKLSWVRKKMTQGRNSRPMHCDSSTQSQSLIQTLVSADSKPNSANRLLFYPRFSPMTVIKTTTYSSNARNPSLDSPSTVTGTRSAHSITITTFFCNHDIVFMSLILELFLLSCFVHC